VSNLRSNALNKALVRLGEALAMEETDVVRDACIQRFEFCFELAWKVIQEAVRNEGQECVSPRSCLKQAFKLGWIVDENGWLGMLTDRNLTSHTYDEKLSQAVYRRLSAHLDLLEALQQKIKQPI
jgi:nucleotidyltransferase substrate binding protein (TIGR01987 family)